MARGSLHFLRVQLQQSTTGFGFQLGLQHYACLVRLHLSCDFSASFSSSANYLLQLFPRSDFFLLSNECVLKCSEVQYFTQNILK